MLEKIIKIENIKQWQHKGGLSQSFDMLNLIYGRNGSGKSTLCKIFECINLSDKSSIEALQPIESQSNQALELRIDSQNVTLDSLHSGFTFQIFDQAFIDNNLYISNSKDRKQLSNYYEFSLGKVSVEKEKEIELLKVENDALTIKISPITTRLTTKFPSKTPTKISAIKFISNADSELISLQLQLEDIKSVQHFKNRKSLSILRLDKPKLKTDCFIINIEQLSKDAEEKVNSHIYLNLKEQDNYWLETGMELVTETNNCPFCAQSLSSSPIFHHYQEFINESYQTASNNFEISSGDFELSVMDIGVKIEELGLRVESNKDIIREWSDRINNISLDFDFSNLERLSSNLSLECSSLIKMKNKDLLYKVDLTKFEHIFEQIFTSVDFTDYNNAVNNFNHDVNSFVGGLGTEAIQSVQSKINNLEQSILRFTSDVVTDLADLKNLEKVKKINTAKIKNLRSEITEEQRDSIGKHKDSINSILEKFHSMIKVKELDKDNKGKGGSTRLNYVIDFIGNELSVLKEDEHEHIFQRVLSLGDRSALALAFFLSRFSKVNDDKSIIVLDDPMSSLDSYRKDATIIQVAKLIDNKYQTFVFSHDPFFLSDVYKHSILSKHSKCFEIELSYKDLDPLSHESTKYISSKMIYKESYESYVIHSYHKEYNKLYDFVSEGNESEELEVARSIRPILEAYLRFLYPKDFVKGMWLGDMISKIREETNVNSQFYDKYGKFSTISEINDFSKEYHHADGFDTKIQGLDFQTVQYYAKSTLKFITGFIIKLFLTMLSNRS